MSLHTADERSVLEGLLDVQRAEVALLLDEVDDTVRADFDEACDISRAVAAAHDLDETWPWYDGPVSLRYVYGHMIAELARHAGHGDILVEQLLARRASAQV
jgi:hypothetical protein